MDREPFTGELWERLDSGALQFPWCLMFFPLIESDADTGPWAGPLVFPSIPIPSGHQSKNHPTRSGICWLLEATLVKIHLSARSLIRSVEGQRQLSSSLIKKRYHQKAVSPPPKDGNRTAMLLIGPVLKLDFYTFSCWSCLSGILWVQKGVSLFCLLCFVVHGKAWQIWVCSRVSGRKCL